MSQHHDQSVNPTATTKFVYPPVPLASGDTLYEPNGDQRRVVKVTLHIHTDDSDTPGEVELEPRFGGWWAPMP